MNLKTPFISELRQRFETKQILTLDEIKIVLNTDSRMTIHRKLHALDYRSSYSHKGKYYTLNTIAHYDRNGLWEFNGIYFSKYDTLSKTIEHLVNTSEAGFFASELNSIVKVFVQNELLNLYKREKIQREQINREFLYLSTTIGEIQLHKRKAHIQESVLEKSDFVNYGYDFSHIECLQRLLSVLNEKQRRLLLGFESLRIGYGGDKVLSKIAGVDARTISHGRKELLSHHILPDRIRAKGAGRPSVKKNRNSK